MSEQTANTKLPYILPSQAQKHVTHNEALRMLDAIVQMSVLDRHLAAPPASPTDGDRYIVAAVPTGAWAGRAGSVAAWQDGVWNFHAPEVGWLAWVADENDLAVFDGSAWVLAQRTQNVPMLGINATADAGNRLAVRSASTLFDHVGAGHQHKVNKAAAASTASLLLQNGYSGRAELGLIGDDDLRLKVSADGATWNEVFVADRATGTIALGKNMMVPDGSKIANQGTASTSGLELEGGGIFGKVGLVLKSVAGLTGALFEQRSANPAIDLIDFGFKTLTQQSNIRVESRAAFTHTGAAPELQFFQLRQPANPDIYLFAISPKQARSFVPFGLPSYTVAGLPGAATVAAGAMVYVSNEAGGAVPAFSDGTSWRRVTDRVVVS